MWSNLRRQMRSLAVFDGDGPRTKATRHKGEDREAHTKSTKGHKEPIVGRGSSHRGETAWSKGFAIDHPQGHLPCDVTHDPPLCVPSCSLCEPLFAPPLLCAFVPLCEASSVRRKNSEEPQSCESMREEARSSVNSRAICERTLSKMAASVRRYC